MYGHHNVGEFSSKLYHGRIICNDYLKSFSDNTEYRRKEKSRRVEKYAEIV
jgi:hypothetical protein